MRIRILVVEDEAEIADFLVRGLSEEGFTVERVADGESALKALAERNWDLVLLDWGLPGKDGLAVLKEYRDRGGDAQVLFLTARDAVSDRVMGLEHGADDYLCKPFAFEELLARVRVLLRRKDGSGNQLRFDDVSVDLVTQKVERAGEPIYLKAREYGLLIFFLRHPGEVLSRTRIYEHVWEEQYDGVSNTLEVHVMELRRKLEAAGSRIIHTLRGRGYVLDRSSPGDSV